MVAAAFAAGNAAATNEDLVSAIVEALRLGERQAARVLSKQLEMRQQAHAEKVRVGAGSGACSVVAFGSDAGGEGDGAGSGGFLDE